MQKGCLKFLSPAAAQADLQAQGAAIGFDAMVQAVADEYRNLVRQVPAGLLHKAYSG